MDVCLREKVLLFILLWLNIFQQVEGLTKSKYELIIALQTHFSSNYVVIVVSHSRNCATLSREMEAVWLQVKLSEGGIRSVTSQGVFNSSATLPQRSALFVLISGEETKGHQLQKFLSRMHRPDVRWLMFLENSTIDTDELLDGVNIPYNCKFLVTHEYQETMVLREAYRVAKEFPMVTSTWGMWSQAEGLHGPVGSMYRRRSDLQGLNFVAAALHDPPRYHLKTDSNGNVVAEGLVADLCRELSKELNFSITTLPVPGNVFGIRQADGSWSGLMGLMLDGTVNLTLSALKMTRNRAVVVDFTVPVTRHGIAIYIHTADERGSRWGIYVAPFSVPLWLTVVGCIFVATCILGTIHRILPSEPRQSFTETFVWVWGSFCLQGEYLVSGWHSVRLVQWFTLVTALVILMAFSARLISFLAVQRTILPFTDLKGLLEDKSYGFGMIANRALFEGFKNGKGVRRKLYLERILPNEDDLPRTRADGFQRTCDTKYAFITVTVGAGSGVDGLGCDVTALPDTAHADYWAIMLPKGSPYRSIINYSLLKILQSGVYRRLHLKWAQPASSKVPPSLRRVHWQDIVLLLTIITGGILMSLIFLFIEIFFKRRVCQISHWMYKLFTCFIELLKFPKFPASPIEK